MLSDRVWQIIGAVAGVIALAVTVIFFFYGEIKGRKQLEATLISEANLINPAISSARKGLEITYEGKPIPDLFLFQLRFRNIGRQPIVKADFEEPIRVQMSGINQIISAERLQAIPTELSPQVNVKDTTTFIEGALLNPDDQFTVEIIAIPNAGVKPSVQAPSARITGIKAIEFKPKFESESSNTQIREVWKYMILGALAMFGLMSLLVLSAIQFKIIWSQIQHHYKST